MREIDEHAAFLRHERNLAIRWAQDAVKRCDWVILDTETTGLEYSDEVCQVAVIDDRGQALFDSLVRPTIPISAGATRVHGISDRTVESAPSFDQIYEKLVSMICWKHVLGYNAKFDRLRLWQSAWRYKLQPPVHYAWDQCVMEVYARFFGEWNDYHGSFRYQKLPPIEGESAHSALADCKATLALIQRMAETPLVKEEKRGATT